jgi:predicted Co/Zn/Cd cation transporter (cation efflux family)
MDGFFELMMLIFGGGRRWYYGLLFVVLFLLHIIFTLFAVYAVYVAVGSLSENGETVRIAAGIVLGLSFINAIIYSWLGFYSLARRTAASA